MPVEFSVAAYRLGHSMVREVYGHNRVFTPGGGIPATLGLLFEFSGLSGGIVGNLRRTRLRGRLRFSSRATGSSTGAVTTISRRLRRPAYSSTRRAGSIRSSCRDSIRFRAVAVTSVFRNLRRGVIMGLPSGQSVAKLMEVQNPLTEDEIASGRRMEPWPSAQLSCIRRHRSGITY